MSYEFYNQNGYSYSQYKQLAQDAKEDVKAIREDIYDALSSDLDLNGVNSLTNPSRTSIYQIVMDIVAFVMYILKYEWVSYEQYLISLGRAAIPHTAYWYSEKAKEFQYGDTLEVVNGAIRYPVLNSAAKIIAVASVKEANGRIYIKVAKLSGSTLVALNSTELLAFEGYIGHIKDAGIRTQITSQNSDVLKVQADIYYDPIVPLPTVRTNVESAINLHLKSLPFDGIFSRNGFIDAVQKVRGVRDLKISTLQVSVAYNITPQFLPVDVWLETSAGYLNIDANSPLATGLNFIPYA